MKHVTMLLLLVETVDYNDTLPIRLPINNATRKELHLIKIYKFLLYTKTTVNYLNFI